MDELLDRKEQRYSLVPLLFMNSKNITNYVRDERKDMTTRMNEWMSDWTGKSGDTV